MTALSTQSWFVWALALTAGFPLAAVLLGELTSQFERRDSALAKPLRAIRNLVLPALVLLLFCHHVLGYPYAAPLLRLFATLFWIVAIYAALSLLDALLFQDAAADSWRARVPALFLDLSRFVLVLVGVAIVLSSVWGADLGGLLTALGVGSIVIGLALQDTLSNIFAGISILFERPYTEGDWVQIDGTVGRVVAINWRATRLETRDLDTVVIPNGVAASATILNESKPPGPRYESYDIGFSYRDPPNKVKAAMLEAIRATEGVLSAPPPMVRTLSYDDSSISYQVRFAVEDFGQLPAIKDDFATRIWYAAQRSGLNIPFPIRTLYHYDGPTVDEQHASEALEQGLEQLDTLLPSETDFSSQVSLQHYGAGERIIDEGEQVHALYTVLSGQVRMSVADRHAQTHEVARLGPGELFGGAALLRRQASSSAFSALDDVTAVVLSAEAVTTLVERKPSFARQMEELIDLRLRAERSVRQQFEIITD